MKLKTEYLSIFLMLLAHSDLFGFTNPESCAYDPLSKSTYISNFGGKTISVIDSKGDETVYKSGLSQPMGMLLNEGVLYAIDSPKCVKKFALDSAEELFCIEIPEAVFLNDVTRDPNGILYVTDSAAGFIYRIDTLKNIYERLFETPIPGVNGIFYDCDKNRIITCVFKNHGKVLSVDPTTGAVEVLKDQNLFNLDGIARDEAGSFYISTWGKGDFSVGFDPTAGGIYRFDADFKNPPELITTGWNGPADILYCKEKKQLLIPSFLSHEFATFSLE